MNDYDRCPIPFAIVALMCAIAFVLLCTGCGGATLIKDTGESADPPYGWLEYCTRHREDHDCQARPK